MRDLIRSHPWPRLAALALAGLTCLTPAAVAPASADEPAWPNDPVRRPYIFTQQHNVEGRPDVAGRIQQVRLGWPLQVQLPGNPAIWRFASDRSALVEPRGQAMIHSPARIEGTESILMFDFVLAPEAKAGDEGVITLTTTDLPHSLDRVIPTGVFVIEFSVIDPR